MPLAATGIICLGLVPVIGGPEQPLHWAMTAGVVGFGALLLVRRLLRGPEAALRRVPPEEARHAGRTLFVVCGFVGGLVALIVGARLRGGEPPAAWSVMLPVLGLAWLGTLALQVWHHREHSVVSESVGDRPSRRPANWDASASRKPSPSSPPDRHVSA